MNASAAVPGPWDHPFGHPAARLRGRRRGRGRRGPRGGLGPDWPDPEALRETAEHGEDPRGDDPHGAGWHGKGGPGGADWPAEGGAGGVGGPGGKGGPGGAGWHGGAGGHGKGGAGWHAEGGPGGTGGGAGWHGEGGAGGAGGPGKGGPGGGRRGGHGGRGGRRGPRGGFGGFGGPGPYGFGPGFDPRMFGRGPRGFGRGRRARKGDVRAGALALLAERPMNGYQVIQELAERSNGYWRPSPGSVYPALQQLEDEGLVRVTEVDGRKAYELTDEGRSHVEANPEQYTAPWDALAGDVDDPAHELANLGAQLGGAVVQVVQAGNDAQLEQAKQVLTDARRRLYRILADDEDSPSV